MARSRRAVAAPDQLAPIEKWYREELAEPAVLPHGRFQPVRIGPTWQTDGDHWLLPDRSLGWTFLAWSGRWLQERRDEEWRFTLEQARFALWWYAVDDDGVFLYRDAVLQRLKGWGKDPFVCALSLFELVGDCRVADLDGFRVIGKPVEEPWVQCAAVALDQTKNTMKLVPQMLTAEAEAEFRMQPGKEQVYALDGRAYMQAVTSSPKKLEGARASFLSMGETQHWDSSNGGHDMADVIERNATKSKDGAARTLRHTNAYEPGMDSVGERDREAFEAVKAGTSAPAGLLYDSLEAPPDAPLTAEAAPEVVRAIRGDSVWLNEDRIVSSILDTRNPPSRSRRFWYNQIVATEDAWVVPAQFDALGAEESLTTGEKITMFFDGSKSDDASGLVACRVSDGKLFQLGVWVPDPAREVGWCVDRNDVDQRVEFANENFNVVGFWADPSDTRDDTGERYWEALVDEWHRRYKKRLTVWATKTGDRQHAVAWDMRSQLHQAQFTGAAERFVADVEAGDLAHDNSQALRTHVKNARRRPNKYGVSFGKEHRESARKVDLAVCAVGARMIWRQLLNTEKPKSSGKGRVIVLQ